MNNSRYRILFPKVEIYKESIKCQWNVEIKLLIHLQLENYKFGISDKVLLHSDDKSQFLVYD